MPYSGSELFVMVGFPLYEILISTYDALSPNNSAISLESCCHFIRRFLNRDRTSCFFLNR